MELVPDGTEEFILDGELYVLLPNPDVFGKGMLAKLHKTINKSAYNSLFILDGHESYFQIETGGWLARYDKKPTRDRGGLPWAHTPCRDKDFMDYYISHGKWNKVLRSNSRLELIDQ
jgi:hypothetical protein